MAARVATNDELTGLVVALLQSIDSLTQRLAAAESELARQRAGGGGGEKGGGVFDRKRLYP